MSELKASRLGLSVGFRTLLQTTRECPDIAFGLCDLGYPELGSVSISELESVRGPLDLGIERDRHWTAKTSLSDYAEVARAVGGIIK